MSKLIWPAKSARSDPARTQQFHDFVTPDGRKIFRKKCLKKKKQKGKATGPTSRVSRQIDRFDIAPTAMPFKQKARKSLAARTKGNGLTIAEIVAKAEQKVFLIENEIVRTTQRLTALQENLARAMNEADAARNLPRKTAVGTLQKAQDTKSAPQPIRPKRRKSGITKAERNAEREARQNYRIAPKEVEVEHRAKGVTIHKRIVRRS